jgi:predicted transcriptional regulator of viral defense system
MQNKKLLENNLPNIIKKIDSLQQGVFRQLDISRLLDDMSLKGEENQNIPITAFIDFLLENNVLTKEKLKFPSRTETRYLWGNVSVYELALSLKQESYLTHHTAVFLHGLTDQEPICIYLNYEQPRRKGSRELTQEAIDRAFQNKVRTSNNCAGYHEKAIILRNGMFSDQYGVMNLLGPNGERLRVTGIERTLIDITVRPIYAGGVFSVLDAYRLAKGKFSTENLADTLRRLDYIYPYHQAIGYYLEKTGCYEEIDLEYFRQIQMKYRFYLTHKMEDVSFSERWQIYYPKEFDNR